MLLETERLSLREMTQADYPSLCRILQDEQVMYAYEGAFSDAEIQEWLDRQISRYQKWQFGLWAVILKETGELIGQCGLTMQPWKNQEVLEIGYLFQPIGTKAMPQRPPRRARNMPLRCCTRMRSAQSSAIPTPLRKGSPFAMEWR